MVSGLAFCCFAVRLKMDRCSLARRSSPWGGLCIPIAEDVIEIGAVVASPYSEVLGVEVIAETGYFGCQHQVANFRSISENKIKVIIVN